LVDLVCQVSPHAQCTVAFMYLDEYRASRSLLLLLRIFPLKQRKRLTDWRSACQGMCFFAFLLRYFAPLRETRNRETRNIMYENLD
jgi:hypothetical protein